MCSRVCIIANWSSRGPFWASLDGFERHILQGGVLYLISCKFIFQTDQRLRFFDDLPMNVISSRGMYLFEINFDKVHPYQHFREDVQYNDYSIQCIKVMSKKDFFQQRFKLYENGFCCRCGKENGHTVDCLSKPPEEYALEICDNEKLLKQLLAQLEIEKAFEIFTERFGWFECVFSFHTPEDVDQKTAIQINKLGQTVFPVNKEFPNPWTVDADIIGVNHDRVILCKIHNCVVGFASLQIGPREGLFGLH